MKDSKIVIDGYKDTYLQEYLYVRRADKAVAGTDRRGASSGASDFLCGEGDNDSGVSEVVAERLAEGAC